MADARELSAAAVREVGDVLERIPPETADRLCAELASARRIACYGVGREGLMMKALCMRLMHLGLDAHVVGDMTTPAVGPGDLCLRAPARAGSRPSSPCSTWRAARVHAPPSSPPSRTEKHRVRRTS